MKAYATLLLGGRLAITCWGEITLAYAYQHAEAEGAVSGGLTDFSVPQDDYFLLDHDQRHTLQINGNFSLPGPTFASASMY